MKYSSLLSKKALTISTSTVLCTLALGSSVFAAQSESSKLIDLDNTNLTSTYETDTNINVKAAPETLTKDSYGITIEPRISYMALEDSIGTGRYWDQAKGYGSYRIYVNNTQNQEMTFTVSYPGGKSWSGKVPANDHRSYVVNNAVVGRHYVAFTTKSGTVSGNVAVRSSEEKL